MVGAGCDAVVIAAVVKSGLELSDSDMSQHISSCLTEAERFQPPPEIFAVRIFKSS